MSGFYDPYGTSMYNNSMGYGASPYPTSYPGVGLMGSYPQSMPYIQPGSGQQLMITPTGGMVGTGGLLPPMTQAAYIKRTLSGFLGYLKALSSKGINWRTLNIKDYQNLITVNSSFQQISQTLNTILQTFQRSLVDGKAWVNSVYSEIKNKKYGEKYNNYLDKEKQTIETFVKVFEPFKITCSPLGIGTGLTSTESQRLYSNSICKIYNEMVALNKLIKIESLKNDFEIILNEIEKILVNEETINANQTQLAQLLSDMYTIHKVISESNLYTSKLDDKYKTIIKRFPQGSLASIEIATATDTLPTSPPPAPLTTIKFARNRNRNPQQAQFTQEQVSTAIQGAQADINAQAPILPSTTPEGQMMNPGVAVQVAGGRKFKMGSFFKIDEDTTDMIGGSSRKTSNLDQDLVDQYITIENDNKDVMVDHHFLDDNETEEIIITPKKQRK